MAQYLKLYLATLLAFFVIDMLWLGVVARDFYQRQLGFLLRPHPNWFAAIVFYLLFIAGLLVFVIVPGLQAGSAQGAAVGRDVRADHLRHLRSDEPGDRQGLALVGQRGGSVLGRSVGRFGQLRRIPGGPLAGLGSAVRHKSGAAAAVDGDHGAGDACGVGSEQEADGGGRIFHARQAERTAAHDGLQLLALQRLSHLRFHVPGGHAVDRDSRAVPARAPATGSIPPTRLCWLRRPIGR